MKNIITSAILDRVERRIRALGISERAASIQASGKPDVIRNWRKNDKILPRLDTLIDLAKALRTTPEWLAFGIGPGNSQQVKKISWVSAGAFANGEPVMEHDDLPVINVADLPYGDWYALEVNGDSMDYISPPGSIIIVNRRDRELVNGASYVIQNEGGEATYKRFRTNPHRFEPYSHNPAHETIFVSEDKLISVFGRVYQTIVDTTRC